MSDVTPIILADAPQYGLDPYAVLAVAPGEGGLDGPTPGHYDPDTQGHPGWSYGPFQLRSPGALPIASSGAHGAGELYAWSRVGIDYALQQMAAAGARGQSGSKAIDTIVRQFERPARPDPEIAAAVSRYRGAGKVSAAGSSSTAQDASFHIPNPLDILPHVPNPLDALGDVAGAVGGAAHTVAAPFEAIAGFFTSIYDIITSQNTWIRVGFFVGGVVLVIGGLAYAFAPSGGTPVPIPV